MKGIPERKGINFILRPTWALKKEEYIHVRE